MDQKKILMLIAQRDFRDEEYEIPKEVFEKTGYKVETASERAGDARGKLDAIAWANLGFNEVNVANHDALIFVGGPGMEHYFYDEELLNIAREAQKANKIIGAICIAPQILANAGILQGVKVTAFSSDLENLKQKGAVYTGDDVSVDRSIVTASGPEFAKPFAEEIVKILEE